MPHPGYFVENVPILYGQRKIPPDFPGKSGSDLRFIPHGWPQQKLIRCGRRGGVLHFCRMKELLIALAQVNFGVGALNANADRMLRAAAAAAAQGAGLIVFPEMALSGYPPEDLVLKRHFLADGEAQLARLARELPLEPAVIVGCPRAEGDVIYNTAVVFRGGRIAATYRKMLLPNYGVFDEKRVFAAGTRALGLELDGWRIGLHICEDSWVLNGAPCRRQRQAAPDLLVNISASPYHRGKLQQRETVLGRVAAHVGAPVAYCNLVGGQDELVFDGASLALTPDGRVLARARQCAEDLLWVALPPPARPSAAARPAPADLVEEVALGALPARTAAAPPLRVTPPLEDLAEVYAALELGLRDYVDKNRFQETIVSLSGGIDSALVATLAVDALGAPRVHGVTLPSRFSSAATLDDALRLAKQLGVDCRTIAMERLHQAFLEELAPVWPGREPDATEENLQARIRGTIVMALSNKFGWLVLTTGNKSEIATGYCTLYGDMAGGFAVLKDVPKTLVFELARWRNRQGPPPIPESIIARPPSAELRPGQQDSDSLPPYDVLDPILERYIERDWSAEQIIAVSGEAATVRRVIALVDRSEYKRRQGAPGIKITPRAFSRDRRMPITNLYNEQLVRSPANEEVS